jgi:hypothetical protein
LKDQGVWGVADAARVFLGAIVKYVTQRGDEMGNAVFDKVRGMQFCHCIMGPAVALLQPPISIWLQALA